MPRPASLPPGYFGTRRRGLYSQVGGPFYCDGGRGLLPPAAGGAPRSISGAKMKGERGLNGGLFYSFVHFWAGNWVFELAI